MTLPAGELEERRGERRIADAGDDLEQERVGVPGA